MKRKIGILLERDTIRLAKLRAAQQKRALSDLIEEALVQYLRNQRPTAEERKMAFHLFCDEPMEVPPGQLRYIIEEDALDQ